jgi:hypothetical protein
VSGIDYPKVNFFDIANNCFEFLNNLVTNARLKQRLRNAGLCWCRMSRSNNDLNGDAAMTDFRALLSDLRRPQLLIRAARLGLSDYRRDRDLKRLLNGQQPSPDRSVPRLLSEEEMLEENRQRGDAGYSVMRHIEVMIALMAEVRLLPRVVVSL